MTDGGALESSSAPDRAELERLLDSPGFGQALLLVLRTEFENLVCEDVEEVVQDALFAAHQRLDLFRQGGPAELLRWVIEIGKNVAKDLFRKAPPWKEVSIEGLKKVLIAPAPADEEKPRKRKRPRKGLRLVRRFVKALPKHEREAITLVDIQELSLGEAAEALEISYAALVQALHRARAKLRALVTQHPEILKVRRGVRK